MEILSMANYQITKSIITRSDQQYDCKVEKNC